MNDAVAVRAPPFASILHPGLGDIVWPSEAPPCFRDLNLDQVIATIVAACPDDELAPIFHAPLRDPDAIVYRQEVMRDLEGAPLRQAVAAFGQRMRTMRERLARIEKLYCKPEKERWLLDAVTLYCDAVNRLVQALDHGKPASRGLRALREFLTAYSASPPFVRLAGEARALVVELSNIRYGLLIRGNRVTVRPYEGEADYSEAVEATFAKFRRGVSKDYRAGFRRMIGLNHVETQILERVALLNPACFRTLETFCASHAQYQDDTIMRFDRDVPFYLAYLAYMDKHRQHGLDFCYPALSATQKEIEVRDACDLALADKLIDGRQPVVRSSFSLRGRERLLVVSGPNQGGKTTFARMVGQLHYLASLGCPVPGTRARLFLCDRIFTHFEKQEDIASLRGKLKDDLVRIHAVLAAATPDSLVILNEIFSSTTLEDALYLSKRIMTVLSAKDVLSVCVTFLAELAAFDGKTVSMVGLVDPEDPTIRTYRVERRLADGLAYAQAIARKYRVTGEWLRRRIAP
ncbi:hypothetical protein ACFCQI_16545 [Rhodanobacter sp. FW102-FHT14D06]|uniref:DNA mismatch repair proteins mutS family domain-containing protein n=2 Tax=unclassified Rhodanobacter TaxID=2621553 RepID=A0AB74UTP8_9GAMM|nr:hypothetical protein [Rhodanobacter denitrificans]UJJ58333.1 hypothetical protein LRK55_17095 [Rhodanobacter denitrificans]